MSETPGITQPKIRTIKSGRGRALLFNGLGLYRYRYLGSDDTYVGVMAQEVRLVRSDAVVRGSDGYLRVDYAALGLQLRRWDEWNASTK